MGSPDTGEIYELQQGQSVRPGDVPLTPTQAEAFRELDDAARKKALGKLRDDLQGRVGRPGLKEGDINDIFSYHAPTPEQIPHYEAIRRGAREFAQIILEHSPNSADQTAAIRSLRLAVFQANAAIALDGKY